MEALRQSIQAIEAWKQHAHNQTHTNAYIHTQVDEVMGALCPPEYPSHRGLEAARTHSHAHTYTHIHINTQVDEVMEALRQSIQAIEAWKHLYQVTKKAICARSPKPWDFSVSPIFAHIDAFLQRCNDLLEVRACCKG